MQYVISHVKLKPANSLRYKPRAVYAVWEVLKIVVEVEVLAVTVVAIVVFALLKEAIIT